MAEICPFMRYETWWVFCHDGHPSYSDEFPSDHTCKAWRMIGKNCGEPVMGCKLIERQ